MALEQLCVQIFVAILTVSLAQGQLAFHTDQNELVSKIIAFYKQAGTNGNGLILPSQVTDPEELKNFTLPNFHLHENWTDWEDWESSPDIRESFPYYRSGYDNDGLVGTYLYDSTQTK